MKKSSFEKVHAAVTQYNVLFKALETAVETFEQDFTDVASEDAAISSIFDLDLYYDDVLTILKSHRWNLHDYRTAEESLTA